MSAQPVERPEPAGAPMTVVFDQTSNFAAIPNLLGYHPGMSMLKGWLTQRLAPIAVRKRLKPGWHVTVIEKTGALCDRYGKELITFEILKGHRL